MFTTDRRMISSTDARCEILLSDNGVRTYNRITDFNEEYFKSKGIDILHRNGGVNFAGLVKLADRDIIYKRVNDKNVKRAYLQLYQDWIGLDREMVCSIKIYDTMGTWNYVYL